MDEEYDSDDETMFRKESSRISSLAQISNKINKIKHTVKMDGYRNLIQILGQLTSQMDKAPNEASVETLRRIRFSFLAFPPPC